jgi:mono/diheme cytochrome c family protein
MSDTAAGKWRILAMAAACAARTSLERPKPEDALMLKQSIMLGAAVTLFAAVAWTGASAAPAGDAQAGKALVDQNCGACHNGMMSMWQGKSPSAIDGLIHQAVAGKLPHPKKLDLTDAQMADIAAYWASAAGK